MMCSV